MQWFKHDATASNDAKLKRVRMKYGLEGYGLYWYCLELIASEVSKDNITFELDHDAEIISHDTGIHYERVQEMMTFMVNLGLFEENQGVISCIKMAQRLDKSMTSNPAMRVIIDKLRNPNGDSHDGVMIESEKVMQDKIRLDKNKHSMAPDKPDADPVDPSEVASLYNKILGDILPSCKAMSKTRKAKLRARVKKDAKRRDMDWWRRYFEYIATSEFLTGQVTGQNGKAFSADIEWILKPENMLKIIEGKYHREG